MIVLITALCIGLVGSGGDIERHHAWFDGDVEDGFYSFSEYAVVRIYSTPDEAYELIWTSDHIQVGGNYEYEAYVGTPSYINGFEPFKVTCTFYSASPQARPRVVTVSGLLWPDDFVEGISGHDFYCTNDF